jgi:acetoin utilization deacetylase AcuC-like enzyme
VFAVVYHADYVAQPRSNGPYQPGKNAWIRDLLRESGRAIDWIAPEPMPRAWIEAVHDPTYVAEVIEARVPALKERRIGFGITEPVARRAERVPGGTFLAGILAIERGFAANSAGGSHHALADTGAGYCVFNDLAIAAVRLAEEGHCGRVLVVDCDVHQGDGTAALTAGRPDIATYSIHAEKNFPARKARSTVDVALPDGTGDDAYLDALECTLGNLLERFRPDLILYQAGVDPFAEDRLGRLALTQDGLDRRDRLVAGMARARGIGLASTPGGGYGPDAREIAGRHVRSILTLADTLADFRPATASRVEAAPVRG